MSRSYMHVDLENGGGGYHPDLSAQTQISRQKMATNSLVAKLILRYEDNVWSLLLALGSRKCEVSTTELVYCFPL
jgi:hypothetical protein